MSCPRFPFASVTAIILFFLSSEQYVSGRHAPVIRRAWHPTYGASKAPGAKRWAVDRCPFQALYLWTLEDLAGVELARARYDERAADSEDAIVD